MLYLRSIISLTASGGRSAKIKARQLSDRSGGRALLIAQNFAWATFAQEKAAKHAGEMKKPQTHNKDLVRPPAALVMSGPTTLSRTDPTMAASIGCSRCPTSFSHECSAIHVPASSRRSLSLIDRPVFILTPLCLTIGIDISDSVHRDSINVCDRHIPIAIFIVILTHDVTNGKNECS